MHNPPNRSDTKVGQIKNVPNPKDLQMTALTVNVSIYKKTITLNQYPNKHGYYLTFSFCSKSDCTINIYCCANEKITSENAIEYYFSL